jgi:hypothetical protein
MNAHDGLAVPGPVKEPTAEEKQAIAELRLDERFQEEIVSQRAARLKEKSRLTVDDDLKTFSPEVIARLIRKPDESTQALIAGIERRPEPTEE